MDSDGYHYKCVGHTQTIARTSSRKHLFKGI